MNKGDDVKIIRIYLSSTDKFRGISLFEEIVLLANRSGVAGASVFRGIMGYGASSKIHSQKLLEINDKVPIVIEIIDSSVKINEFLRLIEPVLEESEKGCLITLSDCQISAIKRGKEK